MSLLVRSAMLPNGLRLQYVERGSRTGVPVLLLHGITDSWRSFEGTLPHLPPWMRAIALTQRGHGDSDRPETGYDPRDYAGDLAAFMESLRLGPAIVVGHSMGAAVAQRFAIDYPGRLLGLVLMGSFYSLHGHKELQEFWDTGVSQLDDPIDPAFAREFQESTLARPVSPRLLAAAVQESLKLPARTWKAAFAGMMADDFAADLGKIRAPTLIAWGDRDSYAVRADQDALLSAIPGARLVVYPGAGHAFHWEEPARFAADLVAFADSVPGALVPEGRSTAGVEFRPRRSTHHER